MKIKLLSTALLLLGGVSLSSITHALGETQYDILKDGGYGCCGGMLGPGNFVMRNATGQFSLGMVNRFIPTYENNWDFGMDDALRDQAGFTGVSPDWGKYHFAEGGIVGGDYIRNEFNMFFNWLSNNGVASFHAHAAYDNLLDINSGDSGGKVGQGSSDFGIERLNGSMLLTDTIRLHAGFEFVDFDTVGGAGLFFGDDTAAAWLVGKPNDTNWYNIGYHVFNERNKLSRPAPSAFSAGAGAACAGGIGINGGLACDANSDDDREAVMGFWNWQANANNSFRFMYAFDKSGQETLADVQSFFNGGPFGVPTTLAGDGRYKFHTHNLGAYWTGNFGNFTGFLQGIYKTGEVELHSSNGLVINQFTGTAVDDKFDVESYAFAAYGAWQATPALNIRVDGIYTSGDDDGTDDDLEGYVCVMCDQRFSSWGGENTFVGDGNFMLGMPVFSHLPEALGNGTPLKVGGIANFDGSFSGGAGRGDNPGYWEMSLVGTFQIQPNIKFKTRARYMEWNEDFTVFQSAGSPIAATAGTFVNVDADDIGVEWTNQLDWALTPNTTIKTQASVFFPGGGTEDLIEAYTGEKEDEEALRLAMEFVWAF